MIDRAAALPFESGFVDRPSSDLSNNASRNGHHRSWAFDPDSFRDTNGVEGTEDTPENVPAWGHSRKTDRRNSTRRIDRGRSIGPHPTRNGSLTLAVRGRCYRRPLNEDMLLQRGCVRVTQDDVG